MTAPVRIERPRRVRDLNDAFRRNFSGGRAVLTAGVAAQPDAARAALMASVRGFDAFDADNDPHGEHDFGAFESGKVRAFW